MRPSSIALVTAFLPCIALFGAYFMSATLGLVPWCVPLIEGCTSISQAARRGDTIFLFRGLMLPSAVFLGAFWYLSYHWLLKLGVKSTRLAKGMFILGVLSAISLALYVDFLGSPGDFSRFMRRYGVLVYFAGNGLAQVLFVQLLLQPSLSAVRGKLGNIPRFVLTIVMIEVALGLLNVAAELIPDSDGLKNAIEWNFAIIMHIFFLASALAWQRTRYHVNFQIGEQAKACSSSESKDFDVQDDQPQAVSR